MRPFPSIFERHCESEAPCIVFIVKISFHSYANYKRSQSERYKPRKEMHMRDRTEAGEQRTIKSRSRWFDSRRGRRFFSVASCDLPFPFNTREIHRFTLTLLTYTAELIL